MNKTDLLNYLKETSYAMTQSDMDEAILLHFELVTQSYRKKPFFYKTLLKYDRYMVALSLLSFSYEDGRVPLSKVKAFCQERGYLSRNSLDAYFSFFFISGYMHVHLHNEDGRQRIFGPTQTALCETASMLKAYLLPSQMIVPYLGRQVNALNSEDLLRYFFRGFSKLLEADLMLDKLMPETMWLVNRAGGHLPMLALYTDAMRNGSLHSNQKVSSYVELSKRLSVSKTHLIRMVKEGEVKGYFKCHKHSVELRPVFLELARKIMSVHFSVVCISIELGMDMKADKYAC